MADVAIVASAVSGTPVDYKLPGAQEILLRAVGATYNGVSASGAFLPALQMLDPAGHIMWTAVNASQPVAAGASALVSWFPGGGVDQTGSSSSSQGIDKITSSLSTLAVGNPTGPTTNLDLPLSGVTAGSYGDSSHSAQLTVDAEGRVTAAASVGIAGGSGTIGFEIGYDQITTSVNITGTTEAAPTTVITCASHTFDGAAVLLTVYCPQITFSTTANATLGISLWEGSTELGLLGFWRSNLITLPEFLPATLVYRFTPSAASHTYLIRAFTSSTTGTPAFGAGAAGTNTPVPAFARFTKV